MATRTRAALAAHPKAVAIVRSVMVVVVFGLPLLLAAGDWGWALAWAYLALTGAMSGLSALLAPPEVLAERVGVKQGAKTADVPLALTMAYLGPATTLLIAGLDHRYGWSTPPQMGAQLVALAGVALALGLALWAFLTNRFFSAVVRIQTERGHTVVSTGPYAVVRHPGYAGSAAAQLLTPLALGSWWALLPAALTAAVIALRTAREDGTLQAELPGYGEYADRVRSRLLPGVW